MEPVRGDYLVIHPDGTETHVDTDDIADVAYMVNVCLFDGSMVYATYNDGSRKRIAVCCDDGESPMDLASVGCGNCDHRLAQEIG